MTLNTKDQLGFSQQLLSLLNAGLPLLGAIEIIASSCPKRWNPWIHRLQFQLKKGDSFSQSLINQGNLFSIEFINLIRVSERTGNLELALSTFCQQLEDQMQLHRKIQQALNYPLLTLVSALLLMIVMMIWVVPVFKEVFSHFQAELPPLTKNLILISTALNRYYLEISVFFLTIIVTLIASWRTFTAFQKKCDRWCFQIPFIGELFRIAALTHWCRILGHLLSSGLPLPEALRLTAQSSNHWLSHDLSAEVFKHLTRGWPLKDALKRADTKNLFFDIETIQLLHIAAESGSLAQMLNNRAIALGSLLSSRLANFSQTLEPLFIMMVGIIIGCLVMALYLPIFNLGQII